MGLLLLAVNQTNFLRGWTPVEAMVLSRMPFHIRSRSTFNGQTISLRLSSVSSSSLAGSRRNLHQSCITMMPEGPEVRAVVDQLQGAVGRRLVDIQFVSGRYVRKSPPDGLTAFAATMTPAPGKQRKNAMAMDWFEQSIKDDEAAVVLEHINIDIIREWNCKGKFIYIILDNGGIPDPSAALRPFDEDFQRSIWITLGMSGRFLSEKALQQLQAKGQKNHVRWYLELMDVGNGSAEGLRTKIYYSDTRNFGTIKFCLSRQALVEKIASLGPDIMSTCTEIDFLNLMEAQKYANKNICKFLMDQSNISGVGNYILAEALYRANVDPFAAANELSLEQRRLLFQELRSVAIESYSSQINDREFKFEYQCYGQKVCKRRGDPVRRETDGPHGRTIWYTDHQLFMTREERSKPHGERNSQTTIPQSLTIIGNAPRKMPSTAGNADTPGNARLAALLDRDLETIADGSEPRESTSVAAMNDDAVALASSLLEYLKEPGWKAALSDRLLKSESFQNLAVFLEEQKRLGKTVYPPRDQIFAALNMCPLDSVKLIIIGQDPYHGGQGHGFAFSVMKRIPPPPSLHNIFKELLEDVGIEEPMHGSLERWVWQGVLLLNTVLTVEKGNANSHAGKGWEEVTDMIVQVVCEKNETVGSSGLVFLLWGNAASKKARNVIDKDCGHVVIESSHPSPLGATKTDSPFLGSKCFSQANVALQRMGKDAIDWNVD